MEIIRDEKRIARFNRLSKAASLFGILSLVAGMILAFVPNMESVLGLQLLALGLGWLLSQIGIYLAHRYVRKPRPDEVLDQALGRVARNGRLYHYVLPASHVLLTQNGVIVLLPKFQGGEISVSGDKWKQKGLGLRRFFGQEQIGNPTKEAEIQTRALASYINKNAPEVEELPMGALIVFTTADPKDLDIQDSRIPAMHHSKVKSYLRRKRRSQPMPDGYYEALRAAFDKRAARFLDDFTEDEAHGEAA